MKIRTIVILTAPHLSRPEGGPTMTRLTLLACLAVLTLPAVGAAQTGQAPAGTDPARPTAAAPSSTWPART